MRTPNNPFAGDRRFAAVPPAPPPKNLSELLDYARAAFTARRQRRALMALDDRMLADIGLSRSQAYREASRSLFDPPRQ